MVRGGSPAWAAPAVTSAKTSATSVGRFSNAAARRGYLGATPLPRAGVGRCPVVELLIIVGLAFLGFFVVGAVMLHILVGLVLLPIKLAFALFKGFWLAILALPVLAVGAALVVAFVSVVLALGGAALLVAAIF